MTEKKRVTFSQIEELNHQLEASQDMYNDLKDKVDGDHHGARASSPAGQANFNDSPKVEPLKLFRVNSPRTFPSRVGGFEGDQSPPDFRSAARGDPAQDGTKRPAKAFNVPTHDISDMKSECGNSDFTREGVKKKEAEKLEFEPWPSVIKFRAWKMSFRREVASKSAKPTEALKWISEVDQASDISDLSSSGSIFGLTFWDFETLDFKIATALGKIIHGDIERRINIEDERQQIATGKMLTGRQIAFQIFSHFKVTEVEGALQDVTDLISLELNGDTPCNEEVTRGGHPRVPVQEAAGQERAAQSRHELVRAGLYSERRTQVLCKA